MAFYHMQMQQENIDTGQYQVTVSDRLNNRPIENARVRISYTGVPDSTIEEEVPLHQNGVQRTFEVQKTLGTTEIKLDVEIANVTIRVLTNAKNLDGHLFSEINENWKKDNLAEWKVCIDGKEGITLSGSLSGLETTECIDEMIYIKPQPEPKKLEWIPIFYTVDGDGVHVEERSEEAVTIWLMQP